MREENLSSEQRWIPVTERLPENDVPVLVNYIGNDDGKMHPDGVAAWTDCGCLWWEGSLKDCDTEVAVPITHWMPLPECRACRDFVDKAQDDLEAFYGRAENG